MVALYCYRLVCVSSGDTMKTFFDTYDIIIPANSIYPLASYNRFITLLENDQTADLRVRIGQGGAKARLKKGLSVELPQDEMFSSLLFENTTGVPMAITIALSSGRVYDNRFNVSGSTVFDSILAELQGDTVPEDWGTEKTIGVAQSQVLAANATRKDFSIQAKSGNAGLIYLGYDNSVTSSKWIAELPAGAVWSKDDYRGPIHAIATVAGQLLGWDEW